MTSCELAILDVGHGNCVVLSDDLGTVVFDAASGETLLEFLEQEEITDIDAVLISHADADHIAGVLTLLLEPSVLVRKIYLNPDAARTTQIWWDFRCALRVARRSFGTQVKTQLTMESSAEFARGEVQIDVLAPQPEIAASGAGGRDLRGRLLTSHSVSAVARIMTDDVGQAILCGDLDDVGLDNFLEAGSSPSAKVLLFPHHGGTPGGSNAFDFAKRLVQAVQPNAVVFSNGRARHGTPRPEIIEGVRAAAPQAHIACTQLSERCAANTPSEPPGHLAALPAQGRAVNACCAGSLHVSLREGSIAAPKPSEHLGFIRREAPTRLCE